MNEKARTEIEIAKRRYTWEIVNFSFSGKPTASALRSPYFSIGPNDESTWHLLLYPYGDSSEFSNNVSLKIALHQSKQFPFSVSIIFKVVSPNKRWSREVNGKQVVTNPGIIFGCPDLFMYTLNRCCENEYLGNFLDNDKLTITCEITVGIDIVNVPLPIKSTSKDFKLDRLIEDFQNLWKNETLSDFTLHVGKKQFPVHKTILAARSPVFAASIKHDMKEKNENTMKIEDTDSESVKEMLRFIYTGTVENLDVLAFELLKLADRYRLEELKEMCSETLEDTITIHNAIDFLILSELHQVEKLKKCVIDFIVYHMKSLIDSEEFKTLQNSTDYATVYSELFRAIALKTIN